MNASRALFPTFVTAARVAGAGIGCALLAGCIGNPFKDAKVDPASPVAGDVARLTRQPAKYPAFASIPKAPTDIRAPRQYRESAEKILAEGEALREATEPGTWTLQNTEAFAAAARKEAGPPPAADDAGQTDAFVREQRQRATPPPPR
jgi:hypothetical protein